MRFGPDDCAHVRLNPGQWASLTRCEARRAEERRRGPRGGGEGRGEAERVERRRRVTKRG